MSLQGGPRRPRRRVAERHGYIKDYEIEGLVTDLVRDELHAYIARDLALCEVLQERIATARRFTYDDYKGRWF